MPLASASENRARERKKPSSCGRVRLLYGIDEVEAGWDLAKMRSKTPMQHQAWVAACAETLVPQGRLRMVVVGATGSPEAVAPLVERHRGGKHLELLGPREVHEPMDLIYRDERALRKLCEAMLALRLPLLFRRVPADSRTLSVLQRTWRGRGLIVSRPARGYPSLPLDSRWTAAEPPLSSSRRRSDLRRARRRAEELGPLRHQIIVPRPEELDRLLEEVFRVEAAGWKMDAGTAMAADPARASFYRRFATEACRLGMLRLCFLRIGERTAAVQLAVEMAQRFWLLKIGYDEGFRRCSPGTVLLAETVRYAAQRGLSSVEFLGVDEPWIEVWTKRVRPHVDLHAYPWGLRGGVAFVRDALRSAWHRMTRSHFTDS